MITFEDLLINVRHYSNSLCYAISIRVNKAVYFICGNVTYWHTLHHFPMRCNFSDWSVARNGCKSFCGIRSLPHRLPDDLLRLSLSTTIHFSNLHVFYQVNLFKYILKAVDTVYGTWPPGQRLTANCLRPLGIIRILPLTPLMSLPLRSLRRLSL